MKDKINTLFYYLNLSTALVSFLFFLYFVIMGFLRSKYYIYDAIIFAVIMFLIWIFSAVVSKDDYSFLPILFVTATSWLSIFVYFVRYLHISVFRLLYKIIFSSSNSSIKIPDSWIIMTLGFISMFVIIRFISRLVDDYNNLSPTTKTVLKTGAAIGGAFIAKEVADKVVSDISNTTSEMNSSNVNNGHSTGVNPDQYYVDGYHRDDGTYAHGHKKTMPNDKLSDNLSRWK